MSEQSINQQGQNTLDFDQTLKMQLAQSGIEIAQIVAMSRNRCIGKNNELPWHIKEDLQHFKAMTTNPTQQAQTATTEKDLSIYDWQGIVIMGRKTFESMGSKLLPKRFNVIISRQTEYANIQPLQTKTNVLVLHQLDKALLQACELAKQQGLTSIWVIGGEQIFRQAMPYTNRVELTLVDTDVVGDTFFPELPTDFQQTTVSEQKFDEKSGLSFQFISYHRSITQ